MGLYLEVVCKPKFWSRDLINNWSAQPSTIKVIEAVISVPSLFQAPPLIDRVP
jgi:hypothetical protein